MDQAEKTTVSHLMNAFREGDSEAGAKLLEMFYPELKRLAARHLSREQQGHSWQPTLLVNELYLELGKIKGLRPRETPYDDDKAAFFGLAGHLMRRLLYHHARPLEKKFAKLPLWEEIHAQPEEGLVEVEGILRRLETMDPVLRTVVEMKVFEGLTAAEIAMRLGCATVTVNRNWQFARHWMETAI